MSNLTNEQIAKIYGMYLECDVLMSPEPYFYTRKLGVQIIDGVSIDIHESVTYGKQLLLTPLSAISDEDAEVVASIADCDNYKRIVRSEGGLRIYEGNGYVGKYPPEPFIEFIFSDSSIWWDDNIPYEGSNTRITHLAYQYLIQKGYAVPLFIEVGHPDNGKTAIELGIAIDKTKATGGQ